MKCAKIYQMLIYSYAYFAAALLEKSPQLWNILSKANEQRSDLRFFLQSS